MGELARQPGCPELAETPLELLTPRPDDVERVVDKWGWPAVAGGLGFLTAMIRNALYRRPAWAGIQTHILLSGLAAATVSYLQSLKSEARADAGEIYKDYITLHKEDFPPFERKRYRDVYQPFKPYR